MGKIRRLHIDAIGHMENPKVGDLDLDTDLCVGALECWQGDCWELWGDETAEGTYFLVPEVAVLKDDFGKKCFVGTGRTQETVWIDEGEGEVVDGVHRMTPEQAEAKAAALLTMAAKAREVRGDS